MASTVIGCGELCRLARRCCCVRRREGVGSASRVRLSRPLGRPGASISGSADPDRRCGRCPPAQPDPFHAPLLACATRGRWPSLSPRRRRCRVVGGHGAMCDMQGRLCSLSRAAIVCARAALPKDPADRDAREPPPSRPRPSSHARIRLQRSKHSHGKTPFFC